MTEEEALSAKQLAAALGTTPRVARKFLRAKFGEVGRGARWGISSSDLADVKRLFGYWRSAEGRPRNGQSDDS